MYPCLVFIIIRFFLNNFCVFIFLGIPWLKKDTQPVCKFLPVVGRNSYNHPLSVRVYTDHFSDSTILKGFSFVLFDIVLYFIYMQNRLIEINVVN